jgi:hypothetical protein
MGQGSMSYLFLASGIAAIAVAVLTYVVEWKRAVREMVGLLLGPGGAAKI